MGQLFESLITAGGYRPRLPDTSPRVVMIVQAASGEDGGPSRLVFCGAVRDPAGGGRAASGRGIILPAVLCCIVVPLVIEREPLPRVRPDTEGATRGWAASPGAATSSATAPTPSIEDTSHDFNCDERYRRPSRRRWRPLQDGGFDEGGEGCTFWSALASAAKILFVWGPRGHEPTKGGKQAGGVGED